jgi:acyl dehydratase
VRAKHGIAVSPARRTRASGSSAQTTSSIASARTSLHAASRLDTAILHTQAKAALTGLGWKPAIAHAAVTAAAAGLDSDVTLEHLIRESLRQCPKPLGTTTIPGAATRSEAPSAQGT